MTVRAAELLMAIVMAVFSVYLMWKSAELPIGWIKDEGPGGGAWPFWLAAVMLACCILTVVRWYRRMTPESRSEQPFMDETTRGIFFVTTGSLAAMLVAVHFIGMYFAMMLFLVFYTRFVGRHSWKLVVPLSLGLPVGLFFFFEALMRIILPKGYSEPLFYPIYQFIY